MAEKLLKKKPRKVAPTDAGNRERGTGNGRARSPSAPISVLVGTYKGGQLTEWRGWYNYPITAKDKITEADAANILELWLFKGTKDERRYKAEFVGVKTRGSSWNDFAVAS